MFTSKKNHFHAQVFTLIEMILAVAILMLVFMAAGTCLMSVQQTWIKTQQRSEQLKQLIIIDKIVEANFPNIVPFEWRDDKLKKRNIFFGDQNKIIFAVAHRVNNMKEGGLRFVSIFKANDQLIVAYRNTPVLFWDKELTPTKDEIIAEGIDNLTFTFADMDRERNLVWDKDWDEDERKNIPMAIQMTIQWKDGREHSWLKRTAGAGKRGNYGRRYYDRATQ